MVGLIKIKRLTKNEKIDFFKNGDENAKENATFFKNHPNQPSSTLLIPTPKIPLSPRFPTHYNSSTPHIDNLHPFYRSSQPISITKESPYHHHPPPPPLPLLLKSHPVSTHHTHGTGPNQLSLIPTTQSWTDQDKPQSIITMDRTTVQRYV